MEATTAMSFTLREILGARNPELTEDRYQCPTGKQGFPSKEAAKIARNGMTNRQHHSVCVFRCPYCERYHLGHRRGS
jgi:hypothetical protein